MARVVRFHEAGGPEVLRIETLDIRSPGDGEVRIAVEAIGLNRSDANYRSGHHPTVPVLPSRLGQEAAGRITDLGHGVTGLAVGNAVSVLPRMAPQYGTMASSIIVPARFVIRHPETLSMTLAAALWAPFLTAYGALVIAGDVQAGEHVVLTAASSSVGLAAIQIANLVGAHPIAVTRSRSKAERLLAAGAAHVIVTEEEDVCDRIRQLTGCEGAELVLDAVAGPGITALADAIRFRGRYVLYGILSNQATPLPIKAIFANQFTMHTFVLDPTTVDLTTAINFVRNGIMSERLIPSVDRLFDLEDVIESFRFLESSRQFGKIVLTV